MNFKNLLKHILGKGVRIGRSTGKPFDPYYQKRKDPIKEMIEKQNKRDKENKKKKS